MDTSWCLKKMIIDEDAVLVLLKDEILILLEEGEEWSKDDSCLSFSSCSTVTVNSDQNNDNNENIDFNNQGSNDLNILELPIVLLKESTWDEFVIPWEKLQKDVLDACEEGKKQKPVITEVIHMVIAAMRQIKTDIHSDAFRTISRKMCEKYPKMFKDYDEDGQTLGSGFSSTFNKLVERNSYLNRPHKRVHDFVKPSVPLNKRRKLLKAKAGCSNWDPPPLAEPNTEDIKTILNNSEDKDERFWEYLEESYAEQRSFINNCNDLVSLQNEWPILFNPKVAIWHFKKLTGSQFENITTFFSEKCKRIIKFGEKKYKQLIATASSESIINNELLAIQILSCHHKEKVEKIFFQLKSADQIKSVVEPCVIETDVEIFTDNKNKEYSIGMEGRIVIEQLESFTEAFVVMFALYFNLNLEYAKEISATLETVQRYMFKIHPDAGSKSKNVSSSKRKAINFINNLAKI